MSIQYNDRYHIYRISRVMLSLLWIQKQNTLGLSPEKKIPGFTDGIAEFGCGVKTRE